MFFDVKQIRPETAKHILARLARELELANAVLDEWDQNRVATKVSQPTKVVSCRQAITSS
jgi:hypothetical protein